MRFRDFVKAYKSIDLPDDGMHGVAVDAIFKDGSSIKKWWVEIDSTSNRIFFYNDNDASFHMKAKDVQSINLYSKKEDDSKW